MRVGKSLFICKEDIEYCVKSAMGMISLEPERFVSAFGLSSLARTVQRDFKVAMIWKQQKMNKRNNF